MTDEEQDMIAFQGEAGANSHLACHQVFPDLVALSCSTFEDALTAAESGRAAYTSSDIASLRVFEPGRPAGPAGVRSGPVKYAMIPIDNSVAGRVADIHHLLPESTLYIVGEHFQRVNHQLMALPHARLADLRTVHSHTQALGQCRNVIRELGLKPSPEADTAGSARMVAESGDTSQAAIASELAARIYGLTVLRRDVEDADHNTTRFIVLAREPDDAEPDSGPVITSFVFRVRSVPAALYKALGGFATNGVNMTKLESYMVGGSFSAAQFYADIEGHPAELRVRLALEELDFFSENLRIFGAYPASPERARIEAVSRANPLASGLASYRAAET